MSKTFTLALMLLFLAALVFSQSNNTSVNNDSNINDDVFENLSILSINTSTETNIEIELKIDVLAKETETLEFEVDRLENETESLEEQIELLENETEIKLQKDLLKNKTAALKYEMDLLENETESLEKQIDLLENEELNISEETLGLVSSEISENDIALIENITNIEGIDIASISKLLNNTRIINCLSSEIKSEIMELYTRYMQARSSGNEEETPSIFNEALELKEKVKEELISCNSTSRSKRSEEVQAMNQEMKDVISTYVEKIRNFSNIENVSQRNIEREQIKQETMAAIKAIVSERKRVNASEIVSVTGKIKILANKIITDSEEINGSEVSIFAKIKNKTINISSIGNSLLINDSGIQVSIPSAEIDEDEVIKINGSAVNVLPSEVKVKIKMKIKTMELTKENNVLVYKTSGEEDRKFFGLFSLKIETKAKINAENGQILSKERPWWAFLTTE